MRSEDSMKVIEPVIQRPRATGLLLIGFKAWVAPLPLGGDLSMREQLSSSVSRAVWDLKDRPDRRLAMVATEHASVRDALRALATELESNQLAKLPQGPDGLGEISFVHPSGLAPPAVFFVRANLVIGVHSFGREHVEVIPFAKQIDTELMARPPQARDGGLDLAYEAGGVRIKPRFVGPDGYLKIIAPNTDLSKKDDTIAGATGELEAFYIEPGRETYSARSAP